MTKTESVKSMSEVTERNILLHRGVNFLIVLCSASIMISMFFITLDQQTMNMLMLGMLMFSGIYNTVLTDKLKK